jgi:NADH-quinone oxidoreductase subunit G
MGVDLGLPDAATAWGELADLGGWDGGFAAFTASDPPAGHSASRDLAAGEAVLATWPMLLDNGRLQDDEPYLAGTARLPVARVSAATAAAAGLTDGRPVTVATGRGEITLGLVVTDLPDGVVWMPTNSGPSRVRATLGADAGDRVRLTAGAPLTRPTP